MAEVASETTEVVHLCVQNGKDFAQRKLQLDVKFPGAQEAPAPFEEILVASGARALALFSPSCCAVVALSELSAKLETRLEKSEALVVSPRPGQKLVKVAWHPMSDAHLGVLFSDGSWSLLNLALSLDEPEVHFPAPLMGPDISVDFQFLAPNEDGRGETPEDLWLSMTVVFLAASGRISYRNPVLPLAAVLSRRSCEALQLALAQAASSDDFAAQLAAQLQTSQVEEVLLLRHRHHLHGGAQPFSLSSTGLLEQVVEEAVSVSSERSSSSFCSLQVCCSSPLLVIARAARGGNVELLALEAAIGPYGAVAGAVAARVLEEIDLMCNKSTPDDFVRLESLGDRSGLIVHTRSLLASIDVSLSAGGLATVTTLAETRSNDMDFASWSRVDQGVGLLLRMERSSKDAKPRATVGGSSGSAPSKSFLTLIELPKKAAAEKASSYGHMSKLSPSSLHLLEQPLSSSKATSVAPAELAKRVAALRSGIASLQCRQDFLKHLAEKSFPARAEVLKQELQLETSTLRRRAADSAQRAQALQLRQAELVQRQAALVKALSAASEARQLEELSGAALPKLYAQLYELRRAAELLRSSQQALAIPEAIRPKNRQLMLAQN